MGLALRSENLQPGEPVFFLPFHWDVFFAFAVISVVYQCERSPVCLTLHRVGQMALCTDLPLVLLELLQVNLSHSSWVCWKPYEQSCGILSPRAQSEEAQNSTLVAGFPATQGAPERTVPSRVSLL